MPEMSSAQPSPDHHHKGDKWSQAAVLAIVLLLPASDLAWNLIHLNIGLADFFGVAVFAHGFAANGAWPATPYFPAGYPLLLIPWGLAGQSAAGTLGVLIGGYVYSAIGMGLAYWAVYRLAREFSLPRWAALLAVVLGWSAPVCRVVAGSPSVDALYTGFGLWFLAASIAVWRSRNTGLVASRWVNTGILTGALVLPWIRYHSVLLLAPILIVLLISLPAARKLVWSALAILLAVIVFNFGSYRLAYGKPLASVVGIQIRCGLEQDLRLHYPTPEHYLAEYPAFCARARTAALTADYSFSQIVRHTARGWYGFMRRPAIAFSFALAGLLLLLRRPLPHGIALSLLWIACYTLCLSPAYYTPRAAALPVLLGVTVVLILASSLGSTRYLAAAVVVAAACLMLGYQLSNRYSNAEFAERRYFAAASTEVAAYIEREGLVRGNVVTSDWRVMPLAGNPWCLPYAHTEMSWINDPEIDPKQAPGLQAINVDRLAVGETQAQLIILRPAHPREEELMIIPSSPVWQLATEIMGLQLYRR